MGAAILTEFYAGLAIRNGLGCAVELDGHDAAADIAGIVNRDFVDCGTASSAGNAAAERIACCRAGATNQ
ncbi:MAG TPA: hypothetical protein VF949_19635 [Reyranella sp.]